MSFMSGMASGTKTMKSWIDTYDRSQQEQRVDQVYKAAYDVQNGWEETNAEGDVIKQEAMQLFNKTPEEIQTSILDRIVGAGGKVDDQTYNISYAFSNEFTTSTPSIFNEASLLITILSLSFKGLPIES